ncbi:alpha/beta hydrolase [Leptolyngbya iicbica]|uniref:Alpha/beta fold hydrolase n=1 Tax=Lyngbya confervoides BDU141951 TaxID=1574623 RepID=A0A8T6QL74_9CYAN|nr:alpha/beta hydrolase [Leptolyngbya sp. LK]
MLSSGAIAFTALPSPAASDIHVQFGPVQTRVTVDDLATFAQTGQVAPPLEPWRPLLTPAVQQSLQRRLNVEPTLRDRFLADLIGTSKGRPFVTALAQIAPDLTPAMIQTALQTAEAHPEGVTAVTLLESLPDDTLTLDGIALMRLLAQLGVSQLEQTALSRILDRELLSGGGSALTSELVPAQPGPHVPQRWAVAFRDHERDRIVPVDLYWSEHTTGPMIVLSHGLGADRNFLRYLAEHLASYGLTVVALEHPGSNVDALIQSDGAILSPEEFVERPRDVSFILDRLADLHEHSFFLRDHLRMDSITLIGHSLGGYTGLVLAGGKVDPIALADFCAGLEVGASSPAEWFQCAATEAQFPPESLADPRITQLVLMNPLAGQLFGDTGLHTVKLPTLFVTSTSDGIASVSDQQLRSFNQLAGPRSLVAIIGGTHLSVGDPENINPALTQVPLMPEHPPTETTALRTYMKGVVLSFAMQQTPQATTYRPFLSAEYAAQFSTSDLPLRFSDRLPARVDRWLTNRDRLARRLTPTFKGIASLMHLELIDAQYRLANLRRNTVAQAPIQPLDLAARIAPRPHGPFPMANQSPFTRASDRPAESPPSAPHSAN